MNTPIPFARINIENLLTKVLLWVLLESVDLIIQMEYLEALKAKQTIVMISVQNLACAHCGNLGAVSPFGQKGESEGLNGNLRKSLANGIAGSDGLCLFVAVILFGM